MLLNYPSNGWLLRASEMVCSVKNLMWWVCIASKLSQEAFNLLTAAVVIWHYLLGGIQCWQNPLLWCGCYENAQDSWKWDETGKTRKCSLCSWNVPYHLSFQFRPNIKLVIMLILLDIPLWWSVGLLTPMIAQTLNSLRAKLESYWTWWLTTWNRPWSFYPLRRVKRYLDSKYWIT